MSTSSSLRGLVQVSLGAILWGTGGLAVQLIRQTQQLSALTLSAERALVGAAVLVVVLVATGRTAELVALVRDKPLLILATGLGTGMYQGTYFLAVTDAGVAIPTVISLGLAPVLLAAVDAVRSRRRPTVGRLLILAAALLGLALVSLPAGTGLGPRPEVGVALAIASGVIYATTTRLGESVAGSAHPVVVTTGSLLVSAAGLAPFLFVGLEPGGALPTSPTVALWVLYLGAGTMALAYALFYGGLRTVPASAATVASLLEPVTAAVAAALVLGEVLDVAGIVGTVLVLLAVAGIAL